MWSLKLNPVLWFKDNLRFLGLIRCDYFLSGFGGFRWSVVVITDFVFNFNKFSFCFVIERHVLGTRESV